MWPWSYVAHSANQALRDPRPTKKKKKAQRATRDWGACVAKRAWPGLAGAVGVVAARVRVMRLGLFSA